LTRINSNDDRLRFALFNVYYFNLKWSWSSVLENCLVNYSKKYVFVTGQAQFHIDYEILNNLYVQTEAYRRAEKHLKNSNILVIIGNPGDGKTALAKQLMRSFIDSKTRCLKPLILSDKKQFDELVKPNNALCVLIDDMLGSVVLKTSELESWGSILGILWSTFPIGNCSQNNVLILTLRKDIFNNCPVQMRKSPIFNERNILDLSLKESLTKKCMRLMLDKYFNTSPGFQPFNEEELDNIYKNSPGVGFPQCCKMAMDNDNFLSERAGFFLNPFSCLKEELDKLKSKGKNKYCSLLIFLFYPEFLSTDISYNDDKKTTILQYLNDIYGYRWEGRQNLRDNLSAMRGLYLRWDEHKSQYHFSHESVQTAVIFSFASSYTQAFIQLSESRHLSILVTDKETDVKTGKVKVDEGDIIYLIKRIGQLLQTKKQEEFQNIANLQIWDDEVFSRKMSGTNEGKFISVYHEDESNNSMLVYFTEREKFLPLKIYFTKSSVDKFYKRQVDRALKVACKTGNSELVDFFLEKAAEPDIDAFMNAVKGTNMYILSKLLNMFPSVIKHQRAIAKFYPDCLPTSVTLLHQACFEGNINMVNLICEKCNSLVNKTDVYGRNALHIASSQGHVGVCTYLTSNYPALLHQPYAGRRSIHEAAESGRIPCFQLIEDSIIKENISIENYLETAVTDEGETVYHSACKGGKQDMCEYIQIKYPFLLQITKILHPLHAAAWSGDIKLFQSVLEYYSHEHDTSNKEYISKCFSQFGSSILLFACQNGKTEMCKYIIDMYPGLINIKNNSGLHALHYVSMFGDLKCFQMLLSTAVKEKVEMESFILHTLTTNGKTILSIACSYGNYELCRYIIENYPDLLNIKNN